MPIWAVLIEHQCELTIVVQCLHAIVSISTGCSVVPVNVFHRTRRPGPWVWLLGKLYEQKLPNFNTTFKYLIVVHNEVFISAWSTITRALWNSLSWPVTFKVMIHVQVVTNLMSNSLQIIYRNLKSNLNKKVCCLSSPLQLQMHHYNISLYWPSLSLTRKPFQGRQLQQQKNQSLACTLLLHMSLPKAGIAHNYQDACKKYLSFLVAHHGIVVNFDFFVCYRLLGQNKRELTKAYYCCITTAC